MCAIGESPRDPAPGVEPGGHEQSSIVPEGPKSTAELAEAPPSGSKVVPPAPQFEPLTAPPVPDISRDLYTRGCPACDHLRRIAFDFLSRWQYALSTNEKVQAEFAAGLGFCHHHAWQLESVSSPVGSSVGYLQLAERIAGVLADAAARQTGDNPCTPWSAPSGNATSANCFTRPNAATSSGWPCLSPNLKGKDRTTAPRVHAFLIWSSW